MSIVNIQDVRIAETVNPKHPNQEILTLNYLNRQYSLVQFFPLSRLDSAQNLWRHLTTDRSQICIIVKDNQKYSVWAETIQKPVSSDPPDLRLESVFRAQLCLIDGLWAELEELLGQNQSAAFGKEILISIPKISSRTELLAAVTIARQHGKSLVEPLGTTIDLANISAQQLSKLYQEIQRLGDKYLGKNYTKELFGDLQQKLPPQLKQSLQNWLGN
ncbi:hypothetical protein [Chamaesiphon sp. VAR_48_metabat_135_sub]|uniref:Npun_F0813 family protein n=1 Tax=Chamaesiphon sp. VAR_48_metabat_135_sub TaxID=2964699 RepID=UPI00286A89AA|nr:hypothetical protein [Chamaesiphon sp. VAR_48_metabat_135_sub]